MNEPIQSLRGLAVDLLVGAKTLEEISQQHGDDIVKRVEEVLRTDFQYDCHGG